MLEDRILVAEQSMTWQLKRPRDFQHSTLAVTCLDGWSERPDQSAGHVSPLSDFQKI